jgi:hypothetical protein
MGQPDPLSVNSRIYHLSWHERIVIYFAGGELLLNSEGI